MPQCNDTCSYAFTLFYNQPFLVYPDSFSIKRLQFSEQARLLIFIYIYIYKSFRNWAFSIHFIVF